MQSDTETVEQGGLDTLRLIYVTLEPVTGVFSDQKGDQTCSYNCTETLSDKFPKKKKKLRRKQLFFDIHILQSLLPVVDHLSGKKSPACPSPLLLGLVCFVCGEEGHAVGPEVRVEVRGLVKTPPAHLAAQVAVSVLRQGLRGGGR